MCDIPMEIRETMTHRILVGFNKTNEPTFTVSKNKKKTSTHCTSIHFDGVETSTDMYRQSQKRK